MKKATYPFLLLVILLLGSGLPVWANVDIEDVLGRHVTLDGPAERIFLGFYFEDYLAIAGPDAYKKVAIFPRHSWQDYRQSQWQTYREIIPEIETITDSGSIYTGTFDFEKLLTTKPDVALLAAWQYDALGDKVTLLEKSGIKVVVVDFNAQTLERHLKSARVIGQVMGTEGRAEAIAQDYEQTVKDVQRRVAKYLNHHQQRRVYVEIGTGGAEEYGKSYANTMWGKLLNLAGANNIANGKIDGSAHLNPEYVLSQDPEVIFISGAHWANHNGSALLGFGTTPKEAQATYHPYLERSGWQHISAVKQGQVYGMYHSGTRTIYDHIFLEFLAKSIYPEAFKDVDPMAHHQAFFEQYMPQKLSGTFMLKVGN
ncbi:ABC transporter substrate-binding protein [Vibrio ostreicida]|uniref:ABC transporter substrate-binding protein n=1 Tax=Vibrio ostreicida TaxID=526588 RepID=UPI003B5903F0